MDTLFDYHAQPKKRKENAATPAHVVVSELRLLIAKRWLRSQAACLASSAPAKEILDLGFAVIDGDLTGLREAVSLYAGCPERLLNLAAILDRIYEGSAVGFPELPIYRHFIQEKELVVGLFCLEWKAGGRLLSIPTEPRLSCQVFHPVHGSWPAWVCQRDEEPRLLLEHIGRVLTIDGCPPPPPLSQFGQSPLVPPPPGVATGPTDSHGRL